MTQFFFFNVVRDKGGERENVGEPWNEDRGEVGGNKKVKERKREEVEIKGMRRKRVENKIFILRYIICMTLKSWPKADRINVKVKFSQIIHIFHNALIYSLIIHDYTAKVMAGDGDFL